MISRFGWLLLVGVTVLPPVDSYLDAHMSRHMLIQLPVLLGLGFTAGHVWRSLRVRHLALGLGCTLFTLGSIVFWTMPLSLDTAVLSFWVDQGMHANMLVAGWSLALGLPSLAFYAKMAFGVYGLAMILTAGVVYSASLSPVCAVYSIQQQHLTGKLLCVLGGAAFVMLVARGALLLRASFIPGRDSKADA